MAAPRSADSGSAIRLGQPRLADTRLHLARALADLGRPAQAREMIELARTALARHQALDAQHARLLAETSQLAGTRQAAAR